MKVLLLTSYNITKYPFDITKCKTKFQVFAALIYKYLSAYEDVEIITMECPPNCKDLRLITCVIPQIDHALFIENDGFLNRHPEFLKQIRKYTAGLICGISMYAKNISKQEDYVFHLLPQDLKLDKFIYLNYPVDDVLFKPTRYSKKLEFMIGGNTTNCIDKFDITPLITLHVMNFINKNNTVDINVKKIFIDHMEIYNNVTQKNIYVNNTINYDMPFDYNSTNIYFVSSKFEQPYFLYELSMLNVLIVAPENYLPKSLVNQLSILTYSLALNNNSTNIIINFDENEIIADELYDETINYDDENSGIFMPWKLIFDKLNTHDIRNKLIEDKNTWSNAVDIIYQKMSNFIIPNKIEEIKEEINKEEINKEEIQVDKTEKIKMPTNSKKQPIILQSQLRNLK